MLKGGEKVKKTDDIVKKMNEYIEIIKREKKQELNDEQIRKRRAKEYFREFGYLVVDELIEEIWGGDIEEL